MPHLLYQLAEDNGIAIEYVNFKHTNIDAIYIDLPGCQPAISLSKTLFDNHAHLRSVLAHEIGHYYTTVKSTIDLCDETEHIYLSYQNIIVQTRTEYRAWRWAADYLIPTNTLKKIYSEDFCEPWQLAEFFDVDESVVKMKLELLEEELIGMNGCNTLHVLQQEYSVSN
jgi:Zn-dependent peptidase ImmA (M78 family)